MSDVIVGSEAGNKLQATIQRRLISDGYAVEGDEVMAEYVLVMLANKKSADQINAELSELIGAADFKPDFTTWLFTVAFPGSARQAAAVVPPPDSSQMPALAGGALSNEPASGGTSRILTLEEDRGHRSDYAHRRPVHRRSHSPQGRGDPTRRRNGNGVFGAAMGDLSRGDRSGGPDRRRDDDRRRGDRPYGRRDDSGAARRYDGDGPFDGRRYPAGEAALANRLGPHPPPNEVQMQDVSNGMPPAFGTPLAGMPMNGFAYPQGAFPSYGIAPGFMYPGMPHLQRTLPPLPTRPAKEDICKFGTKCKDAFCRFSHPSPAATLESGLVLSTENCEHQADCTDKDCPKRHISSAQKNPELVQASAIAYLSKAPSAPQYPPPSSFGPSHKQGAPCKFGAKCTRPGCYFVHPWDHAGAQQTTCRFGADCTRADCKFAHPPGRARKTPNLSQTFGAASITADAPSEQEKTAMSERMKRFGMPIDGEPEKILPNAPKEESSEA
ncbi:uncharacterized protein L969DRAFT_90320 [Mixia osmundae IAM 14324]|uniref:C3H1-type domain-containing protein n=1 Tax=Mixia osmundae (strain CBS 9802 / IAM 14324 / JCM 22182 / KY 12970) TaxID=764103 RepID=G7E245_MIXOS|nr:uncharacterized protein L969DRAFT_90320 [Mixia osmundae IAM 14324]KEI36777.1 hypothetical protein L969DRAFT_90320 [Mixia osmundae IAM 14324]GAA96905.1 hypothetical protein E5Q_03579 [Mixia osmundae IAM 14324]